MVGALVLGGILKAKSLVKKYHFYKTLPFRSNLLKQQKSDQPEYGPHCVASAYSLKLQKCNQDCLVLLEKEAIWRKTSKTCIMLSITQITNTTYSNKKNQTEPPNRPQCAMSACSLLQRPNLDWVFLENQCNVGQNWIKLWFDAIPVTHPSIETGF